MAEAADITESIEEINEYIKQEGIGNLYTHLEENRIKWQSTPVKIGITGESGVGKSSIINIFLGKSADDHGAAEVGTSETTTTPTRYPHPSNSNVEFWDLPGVNTPSFPKDSYLKKISVQDFDFFLILSDRRFTECDSWLCSELKKIKKNFFFVRTKFDEAVEDSPSLDETETKIRSDIQQHLKRLGCDEHSIYLMSNFETDNYDFPKLLEDIFKCLPDIKEQAMVLTLGNISKQVIKSKKKQLKRMVWFGALGSAAAGATPIPGVDIGVDVGILISQTIYMKKQFGLDEESLKILAETTGTDIGFYQQDLGGSGCILFTARSMLSGLKIAEIFCSALVENAIKIFPVVGSVIGGATSFATTYYFLNSVLNNMEKDAIAIYDKVIERKVKTPSSLRK